MTLNPPAPNANAVTFTANPADPNNAVTFIYGLVGQSANTRFNIFDMNNNSVFAATASDVSCYSDEFSLGCLRCRQQRLLVITFFMTIWARHYALAAMGRLNTHLRPV